MSQFTNFSFLNNLKRIFTLLILLSCSLAKSHSNTDPEKKIHQIESQLKNILPSDWQVEVSTIDAAPFQWKGLKHEGYKIILSNPKQQLKQQRPYSKLYPAGKKTTIVYPRMVRYLYHDLDAEYSFNAFERVHPAQLDAVTADYVIIKPSMVSEEKDYKVPSQLLQDFQNLFAYPPSTRSDLYQVQLTKTAEDLVKGLDENSLLKKKSSGKKAIVIRADSKASHESLRIVTY